MTKKNDVVVDASGIAIAASGEDTTIPCPTCKAHTSLSLSLSLRDVDALLFDRLAGLRGVTDLLIDVPSIDIEPGTVAQVAYTLRHLIDEIAGLYRVASGLRGERELAA
ncbi:hypothetical protein EC912_10535 [Luteibacter rhizovicinus]|uniref:Uncharacterized protein n=1 Tax=Luteibacter rhizovicinus TaxID=242606 RepID=A0A4R3YKC6_9GAMM|nr:hypothetical protein [Luteibacter rhizovicinus]TCV93175.1 hypothetical protein EC912_10535 [Luteibacter rhizovicinus]